MTATAEPSAPAFTNRLAREKSPYLLQHAHNPVDWYPWGEEAFAEARRANKPIFLSVGYSTCHWCHVMAHESFENPEVARQLNAHFIAVKVDREERPDIDRLYMTYVQSVTSGGGGWPMSVWLTPDLQPFYGGTYFPTEDLYGRPGFMRVLESLAEAWRTAHAQVVAAGAEAVRLLRAHAADSGEDAPGDASVLDRAAAAFKSSYDTAYGGFGSAPKFPRPSIYAFLLRYYVRTGDKPARESVFHTLRAMSAGGIHDHLGGGFHRYATDARWRVPHFEKMLYDQAQLACAYLDAYQLSDDTFYADVVRDLLDYVRRDLTGPEGQFYSAEDADSPVPGVPGASAEGVFYTWTEAEVCSVLGDEQGRAFSATFGLNRTDNRVDGRHTLAISQPEGNAAKPLEPARLALLASRAKRPRPHLDDKAVTAWNGLMISAYARAYQVLGYEADRQAAVRAADFLRQRLYVPTTGRLFRRYRDGEAAVNGYAEDYAFLIQGLLDLYEADFDPERLTWALALQARQDELFWDETSGGYFSSEIGAPDVLVRMKETHDGAEPSANSVAALNLLRFGAITGSDVFRSHARRIFGFFGRPLHERPEGLPQMLAAFEFYCAEPCQIVIAGKRDAADTRALLRTAQRPFRPHKTVLLADGGTGQERLAHVQPSIRDMGIIDGQAAAYVCEGFACQKPIIDAEALRSLLDHTRGTCAQSE